jgi:hypothetical protein
MIPTFEWRMLGAEEFDLQLIERSLGLPNQRPHSISRKRFESVC